MCYNLFLTSGTRHFLPMKKKLLILFSQIMTVNFENHIKHLNVLNVYTANFFVFKADGTYCNIFVSWLFKYPF